jgi:hypothetical protein
MTALSGARLRMVHTLLRRRTNPTSWGCTRCWAQRSFGRPTHCRRSSSSFGSLFMAVFGWQIADGGMAFRTRPSALFVHRRMKRWITSLLPVFTRGSGWDQLMPSPGSSLSSWWMDARQLVPGQLCRGFDSVVLLVTWCLWKERNL